MAVNTLRWGTGSDKLYLRRHQRGIELGRKTGKMNYRGIDEDDLNVGKLGPCLVKGHPKEHILELNPCWSTMRRFLYYHSWNEYMKEVINKK